MSAATAALASVSVTVRPLIAGAPLRLTVVSLPPAVFFTVKAAFARPAAAPSVSLKVRVSAVPETDAPDTVGADPSTLWLVLAATAACARAAAAPAPERSVPPFASSVFATTATPALDASPAATV